MPADSDGGPDGTAPRPVVYWRPGCPYCLSLRTKLAVARIGYDAVNVREDPAASAVVRAANGGDELVPTVRVGDRMLSNPGLREVRAAMAGR